MKPRMRPPSSLALATPQGGRPPAARQSRFRGGKLDGAVAVGDSPAARQSRFRGGKLDQVVAVGDSPAARQSRFGGGKLGLAAGLVLGVCVAQAATFKVTLLVPADDERLNRARLERALPGHPAGPAADALKVALDEARPVLDVMGAKIELAVVPVADAAAARNAAAQAEKAGAAALVADLPTAALLAAADAVKLPVLNATNGADALREGQCRPRRWWRGAGAVCCC
jgi:nucleotide-binding universal stress UspA family protein